MRNRVFDQQCDAYSTGESEDEFSYSVIAQANEMPLSFNDHGGTYIN